jgi:hypothetical protein
MAEPVSVVASVIAIIQISSKVISLCYSYQSRVTTAPRDLRSITQELQDLITVLQRLQEISQKLEDPNSQSIDRLEALSLLNSQDGPFPRCQTELRALEAKLEPKTGIKAVGQALLWPLKEKDIRKAIERIAGFRALLTIALDADQM